MMETHDTFFRTVLRGMSQSVDSLGSGLSVLNQGTETSVSYKKLIAQYLDVPSGSQLRMLSRASDNITWAMEAIGLS